MKALTAAAVIWLCFAVSAGAQPLPSAPLMKGDASGTIGWFNTHNEEYEDWSNRSLYGGITAGWYWNDHLKTEIDFGANTAAHLYDAHPIVLQGISTYQASRVAFSKKKLAVSQQYQFFRNAWFHPHAAGGVDFSWERTDETIQPVYATDPLTRQPRIIRDRTTIVERDLVVRPFVDVGFKAYMTPRGFFRTDLRVGGSKRIDEVLLRFGFGVDF
jgi:hypothetical protein